MKNAGSLLLLLLLFSLNLNGWDYVPNQLLFKTSGSRTISRTSTGLAEFDSFLQNSGLKNIKPVLTKAQNRFFVASFQQDIDWQNIQNYHFDGIEYIQPNYLNSYLLEPNDPLWDEQIVNLENCHLPEAWDLTAGNGQILVAVVDSGINFDHPDLQNNLFRNPGEIPDDGIDNDENGYVDDWRGWDFVDAPELSSIGTGDFLDQDNDPSDDLYHGTHVSGIIAADTNNGEGVAGIGWNIKLLPIRSGFTTNLAGAGYLQDDDAAAGIIYAADMGADIINLSWGDTSYSPIIADACDYALQMGSILVAAAGNSSASTQRQIMYPAKLASTLAVGAVNSSMELASFSCYGSQLDIVAPGSYILSTYSNDTPYQTLSGTSMAAPFAAACLALLLSFEPGLDFDEVKARLAATSLDLGDAGFDTFYGNGLIDAEALLIANQSAVIEIGSPADFAGFSSSFSITGSIDIPHFFRYSVQYQVEDEEGNLSWQPVDPFTPYYYDPVQNGLLADFIVQPDLPDSTYLIKAEVFNSSCESYQTTFHVYIDQTAPVFLPAYSGWMERYEAENNEYFVGVVFDEAVFLQNPAGIAMYDLPDEANDNHVLRLYHSPLNEPIDFLAENNCGLEIGLNDVFNFERNYHSIDQNGFVASDCGEAIYAFSKTCDFDANGVFDLVGIVSENGRNELKIFEPDQNELVEKYDLGVAYWPHDIGDSGSGQTELLTMNSDKPVLFIPQNSVYPNTPIELGYYAFGANFADYDGDGTDEIVLIKNETVNNATRKVLSLIERSGNDFTVEHTIVNPTASGIWNIFSNRVVCGNLDGDAHPDLVATDLDGDVMVFEQESGDFALSWTTKLPLGYCYYLVMGDFTGDGENEICAGGYNLDYTVQNFSFSYFEIFKATGNNDYTSLGYVSFSQVEDNNSISQADLDGDGDAEIILGVPPNIYVIDYQDGEFVPIWQGNIAENASNVVTAAPQTAENEAYIIANRSEGGELLGQIIRPNEEFSGPTTPAQFTAQPLNENSVQLDWMHETAEYFNVYRKQNDEILLIAGGIANTSYINSGLSANDTLYYRITAIDHSFSPAESRPTAWKSAVPAYPPELTEIEMSSASELKIEFSNSLSLASANRGNFRVEPEIGNPISVNLVEQNKIVLLRFSDTFSSTTDYELYFSAWGSTGVPVSGSPVSFDFLEDVILPEIETASIITETQLCISFSEPMQTGQIDNPANYTFLTPANDVQNKIVSVSYLESDSCYVLIDLFKELEASNQHYFVQIQNVKDRAGNHLSTAHNKCHFSLTVNSGFRNLKQMKVCPNPLNMSKSAFGRISFVNLPLATPGEIRIYDLSGNLIFNEEFGALSHPSQYYSWDCRNKAGKKVSSGMYYYILKMGKNSKQGKLVIVN